MAEQTGLGWDKIDPKMKVEMSFRCTNFLQLAICQPQIVQRNNDWRMHEDTIHVMYTECSALSSPPKMSLRRSYKGIYHN